MRRRGLCAWPTLDQVRAVAVDDAELDRACPCGACAEVSHDPPTVVADCIANTCQAVVAREQPYTECTRHDECVVTSNSCCETCGDLTVDNVFAVQGGSAWQRERCERAAPMCPLVDCAGGQLLAEAYCDTDGRCAARAWPAEATAGDRIVVVRRTGQLTGSGASLADRNHKPTLPRQSGTPSWASSQRLVPRPPA